MLIVDPVFKLTKVGQEIYFEKIINVFKDTNMFEPFEIDWLKEQLTSESDDYQWLIYITKGEVVGASCYGPILKERPGRYDLYWIAVHPFFQCKGIGKKLLKRTEEEAQKDGATHMYIETGSWNSSGNLLYQNSGYKLMGIIEGYYNDNNHKHIWGKRLLTI